MDFDFSELVATLEASISEDAPITVKEGGIFKHGYNQTLDDLLVMSKGGKEWVANLEAREKEKTGISTLKVGFNKIFGYYIEVTRGQLDKIQEEWGYERKQTTINSERFITRELKEQEALILTADERRCALEYELFLQLRKYIVTYTERLQVLAQLISYVDVLISFAEVSLENNEAVVTSVNELNDEVLKNVVEKEDYTVIEIK